MAADFFGVQVDARELSSRLEAFQAKGEDMSPALRVVAAQFVAEMSDMFDTEGSSGASGAWPALHPMTLRQRRKEGRGAKILQDTGRLAASFAGRSGTDFAEVTTDVFYSVFHVEGRGVPRRDFTAFPERAFDEARDTILEALVGAGV